MKPTVAGGLLVAVSALTLWAVSRSPQPNAAGASATNPVKSSVGSDSVAAEPLGAVYAAALSLPTVTAVLEELGPLREQVDAYEQQHGRWPSALRELGALENFQLSEHGGMPIELYGDGLLLVTYGEDEAGGMHLINEPARDKDGRIAWYCYGQNLPLSSLPDFCQQGD